MDEAPCSERQVAASGEGSQILAQAAGAGSTSPHSLRTLVDTHCKLLLPGRSKTKDHQRELPTYLCNYCPWTSKCTLQVCKQHFLADKGNVHLVQACPNVPAEVKSAFESSSHVEVQLRSRPVERSEPESVEPAMSDEQLLAIQDFSLEFWMLPNYKANFEEANPNANRKRSANGWLEAFQMVKAAHYRRFHALKQSIVTEDSIPVLGEGALPSSGEVVAQSDPVRQLGDVRKFRAPAASRPVGAPPKLLTVRHRAFPPDGSPAHRNWNSALQWLVHDAEKNTMGCSLCRSRVAVGRIAQDNNFVSGTQDFKLSVVEEHVGRYHRVDLQLVVNPLVTAFEKQQRKHKEQILRIMEAAYLIARLRS